jgi:hypothetical protein
MTSGRLNQQRELAPFEMFPDASFRARSSFCRGSSSSGGKPSLLNTRQPPMGRLFGSQGLNGLDGGGAACGDETGQDTNKGQAGCNACEQRQVVTGVHFNDRR